VRHLVLAAGLLAAGLAACGGSEKAPASGPVSAVRDALVARLQARDLSYRWVACVQSTRVFAGRRIVRCNVNFGDPHIEVYCAVLVRGRLRTDHENPAIACGRNGARG
jgi:hypothetical protein